MAELVGRWSVDSRTTSAAWNQGSACVGETIHILGGGEEPLDSSPLL
jgi:hypothetical protein